MIKFLIIVFCIYLLLKWIVKPLLRMFFHKALTDFVSKQQGGTFYKEYRYESGGKKKPEGAINVDYVPPKVQQKKLSDDQGEYVDYVEIK